MSPLSPAELKSLSSAQDGGRRSSLISRISSRISSRVGRARKPVRTSWLASRMWRISLRSPPTSCSSSGCQLTARGRQLTDELVEDLDCGLGTCLPRRMLRLWRFDRGISAPDGLGRWRSRLDRVLRAVVGTGGALRVGGWMLVIDTGRLRWILRLVEGLLVRLARVVVAFVALVVASGGWVANGALLARPRGWRTTFVVRLLLMVDGLHRRWTTEGGRWCWEVGRRSWRGHTGHRFARLAVMRVLPLVALSELHLVACTLSSAHVNPRRSWKEDVMGGMNAGGRRQTYVRQVAACDGGRVARPAGRQPADARAGCDRPSARAHAAVSC